MAQDSESPAQTYERYMVPAMFAEWVPDLLTMSKVKSGDRVLDVACGTGIVARNAAKLVGNLGRVAGIDVNSGMVEMARSLDGTVEWKEANATNLPFPDDHFDVAICQQGLQFVPDRLAAVAEMYRVLVPGGHVTIIAWSSLEHIPGHLALAHGLARNVSEDAATLMNGAFSLGADELRRLLREVGFQDISLTSATKTARFPSAEEFARRVAIGSVVGRSGITLSDEMVEALLEDVSLALETYVGKEGLAFPMSASTAVAAK